MTRASPFAWVNGQPYLVLGFDLRRPPRQRLTLRRLTVTERRVLERSLRAAEHEAWAQIEVR